MTQMFCVDHTLPRRTDVRVPGLMPAPTAAATSAP
jgi:hypothetical protein